MNRDFGSIFSMLLPGTQAKLQPPDGMDVLDGLEVRNKMIYIYISSFLFSMYYWLLLKIYIYFAVFTLPFFLSFWYFSVSCTWLHYLSGKSGLWRCVEGELGRAQWRPAISGSSLAHPGSVALQASSHLYFGWGRCCSGSLSHPEHW